MDNLKEKIFKGFYWKGITSISNFATNFIFTLLLARILSPNEFGLIYKVTILTGFCAVIQDFGLSSAIIQKKEISPKDLNTVFLMNIVLGICISIVIFSLAPLIGRFYDDSSLAIITKFLAIPFLLSSFNIVQFALLSKALDFKPLFFISLAANLVSNVIAIYLALSDFGVWSLIFRTITATFVTTILIWSHSRWFPSFSFSKKSFNEIIRFSLPLFGTKSLFYWTKNADKILIGKYMSTSSLGIYSQSGDIITKSTSMVSSIVSSVMFPSLSMIQDNKERMRFIYLKVINVICLVSFPLILLLFFFNELVVLGLYGEKWEAMIPLVRCFALLALVRSVSYLNGNIFTSLGKTKLQFCLNMFTRSLLIITLFISIRYSEKLIVIAYTYSVGSILIALLNLTVATSLLNLTFTKLFMDNVLFLVLAIISNISVFLIEYYLLQEIHILVRLGIVVCAVIIFYIRLVASIKPDLYIELLRIISKIGKNDNLS